jgi:hypothetical protein
LHLNSAEWLSINGNTFNVTLDDGLGSVLNIVGFDPLRDTVLGIELSSEFTDLLTGGVDLVLNVVVLRPLLDLSINVLIFGKLFDFFSECLVLGICCIGLRIVNVDSGQH